MGFAAGTAAHPLKPAWNFACPDWEERLRTGRSLVPDLPINQAEGDRAVKIFNKLRLPDVPGQPTMAEAAGDWFRDIVRAGFGSLDRATGVREVSEIFALVPKKNSKTTGGAGIMITAMLMNERPRAEMLFIGPTQDVADLAYLQATGMIEADDYLRRRFQIIEHKKMIVDRVTKARLRVKTFDLKILTGSKPVVVLVDELHIMSQFSYASRVIGQIRGGLLPNPESLLIFITTQSDTPPAGVFKAELQYARGVRDGRITEGVRTLPILYEFPERMQISVDRPWEDPKNWPMVLPNLNRSISIERLLADWKMAKEKGEEEARRWASQHLNVEIGLALHIDRWIGVDYWPQRANKVITLEWLIEHCDVLTAGVDGGGLDDLLGLGVIGRHRETRKWYAWARAWAQKDVLTRRKDIAERLRDFVKEETLVLCDDATQDIRECAQILVQIFEAGLFPDEFGIGLDPLAIAALVDELAEHGLVEPLIAAIGQGIRLSPAVWGLERKLQDGTFEHDGSDMMMWVVSNAKAEQRGNAVMITKQTAGKAKIDPLVALFNAAILMSRNPEGVGRSVYETRGILEIDV